jgi:hypothetical protein
MLPAAKPKEPGGTPLARAGVSAHNACGKTGPGPPEKKEDIIIYLNRKTGDLCRLARNKRTRVVRRVTSPTPLPAVLLSLSPTKSLILSK